MNIFQDGYFTNWIVKSKLWIRVWRLPQFLSVRVYLNFSSWNFELKFTSYSSHQSSPGCCLPQFLSIRDYLNFSAWNFDCNKNQNFESELPLSSSLRSCTGCCHLPQFLSEWESEAEFWRNFEFSIPWYRRRFRVVPRLGKWCRQFRCVGEN